MNEVLVNALRAEFRASLPAILAGNDPIQETIDNTLDGYVNLLITKYARPLPPPTLVASFSSAPSIATIKQVVADVSGVPIQSMVQDSRAQRFVLPRWVAIYIAHAVYGYPGSLIARRFNRDASTIFYAYREVKARAEKNGELRSLIDRSVNALGARA